MIRKGMGGTGALTAQTSVYGTHWRDGFTSTTAGRIAILMNEPTALSAAQVTLMGGAAFTSAGGLYMPVIGQTATFETPDFILGHTGFANSALVMAGSTATNYTYRYKIKHGNGQNYGNWSSSLTATQLGTALNGETLNGQNGFKLLLEITTGTTNTTAITSVYMTTVSTTTAQDYQYPLDLATVELTGLVTGSDIVILSTGTTTVLESTDQTAATTYSTVLDAGAYPLIDVCIYKAGYIPFILRNLTLTAAGLSLPMNQAVDPSYVE
jgi:hypothetical protein